MKQKDLKRIINLIGFVIVCGFGYCFWGIDIVPDGKYEIVTMQAGQKEAYYVDNWCTSDFGKKEFLLWDKSRCDCLTKDYAIEFDFASKWAESVNKRKPAVVLILTKWSYIVYLKRLESLLEQTGIKLFVIKAY